MAQVESSTYFMKQTGLALSSERVTIREAPYLMGAGFWHPYKVTLTRDGQSAEVIALIDNTNPDPSRHQLLFWLSAEIERLENATSYKQWCAAIKKKKRNDASFLRVKDAYAQEYLQQRYTYLNDMQQKLKALFGEQYAFFCQYWIRCVMNDWGEWPEAAQ